ncbi:hypothetical protein [Paenibacillus sp. HB172176]|uniref:hypothetical protein n=1 Tax=Paenibacillus sp. HB172176 TaxID=2493690 RepID=UPI00143BF4D3|nr:hypothetical protein [Paenibacillus sp. HB172176]
MRIRPNARLREPFAVYVVPAWKWKQFIAFELLGGIAFYLISKVLISTEWFCIAANMAGPQMLKHAVNPFRPS